jgi:cofilin
MKSLFFILVFLICSYNSIKNTNLKSTSKSRMFEPIYPSQQNINEFMELKFNKSYQGLVFSIDENKNAFTLLQSLGRGFEFDELRRFLPKDDCRFVIYNFEYTTDEHPPIQTSKLMLINWCPVNAPFKRKLVFAASKSNVKEAFTGLAYELNPSILQEIEYGQVRKEVLKK